MSASDTATINITAVNDAPVIDLLTTAGVQTTAITAAFTESGGAVTVAPQLTLADVDSTTAAGAIVTLTNAQTGDVLSLQGQAGTSGTLAGGIGFSISGSTVTFSNVSLLANYQAALQLVQFNNTSVTPITTDRSFAFQIDDGGVVNNLANATATVTIGTVNHAPTTADTSASGAEDGGAIAIVLSGNDIDGTVASFTITSLPTNGTLSTDAAGLNPVALNQLITASGNAATLYFTPAANFNGAPSFQYAAIDNNGAQDATPATATINITAVDDAPVATITPTSYGPVNEQTSLTLHGTGLSISDVDAGSGSLTVTLSVTEGTLNVTGGSTGAGVSASGSSLVTITGTQTQINNLLAGNGGATVTYLDNTDTPSATVTLTLTVNDNGLTGSGGPLSASDTATINITAVNDAPVIDLLTTAGVQTTAITAAFTESGGAVTVAPQLTLADVDSTTAAGAIVTLTNAQTGDVLSLQGQAGTSGTLAGGIGFSISGSTVTFSNVSLLANYQAALQLVQFNNTSVTPITTDRSFAFQIDDGGVVNNLANATATVTIGTVNHAPTTADTSASGAEDGGAIAIVLSGNDIDGTVASFTITSLPTNGTLSTDAAGLNPVALNQLITASGNAATLYFTPAANFNGAPSFQYAAIDNNGAQDATPATATINITAVDDAPVATITPTSYGPVNEQTSLTLHGTGLSISDVDAGSGSLTVTLSVTEGTLNVTGGSTGAGVGASGSSLVTITGTQTQINNLLAGNGGATVTYLDNTDTPSATVTLTLTVNDNGLTGSGGPLSASDTATINITAVNDAPVIAGGLSIALNEGVWVTLTTDDLHAVDPDNTPDQLTFNVGSTTNGHLAFDSSPETSIFQFTEQQLENGHVMFVHAGFSVTASFSVTVSDGTATSAPVTVNASAATITVLTTAGMNFETDNPLQQMGSADIVQPDGVSPSTQYTIINTAANREFVINGTGFTYGPSNVPTGGIITSVNEFVHSTHFPVADFAGLNVGADAWYSALVAYAAGDQGPFNTLTGSWAYILNGNSGPDLLKGGQQNDRLIGAGGNDILDGRFGRDTADYSSATGPINVVLAAGTVTGDSSVGTDTLRSVEFIVGTNFTDTYDASGFSALSTNSGSTVTFDVDGTFNAFEGLGGDDIITGNGDTRVSYLSATSGVTVTLGPNGSGTATGDASVGTDTFISGVARIRGSNFADTLTGSNNPAGTTEQFEGRGENDIINGGGGFDRANYHNEDAAIFVHLAAGQVVGGVNTGTDTLLSVESITGTDFSDTYDATGFSGSSTNAGSNGTFNEFEGRGGNDTIIGNGNTRVAFYNATAGVTVTLGVGGIIGSGTSTGDASVGSDTFTGVNAVRGSSFNDIITGDDGSNTLDGRAGDDIINGAGGSDTITFSSATGPINVALAAGTVTGDSSVGTDTLRSVEFIVGTNFTDTYDASGFSALSTNSGSTDTLNGFRGTWRRRHHYRQRRHAGFLFERDFRRDGNPRPKWVRDLDRRRFGRDRHVH